VAARAVIVTASGQEVHALGQRGDAPPMGSDDERATLRTAGDFGQVDRLAPISTANRLKSSLAGEASALRSRHRFSKGQALP